MSIVSPRMVGSASAMLAVLALLAHSYPEASFAQAQELHTPAQLEKACTRSYVVACVELGQLILENATTEKEAARAVKLWQKACDGGNVDGCFNLGNSYKPGVLQVGKDVSRAITLYEKACRGGLPAGCEYFDSTLTRQADEAANASFKAGAKIDESASALAARAYAPLLAACDRGAPLACMSLGTAYMSGDGVDRDTDRGPWRGLLQDGSRAGREALR